MSFLYEGLNKNIRIKHTEALKGGTDMKKIFTLITAIMMVIAMSATAFADSITQDTAVSKALSDAGLDSSKISGLEAEYDDGKYEIEFIQTDKGTEFSYEIAASDGKIIEKSVDYKYTKTKSKKKISKKSARKKAAKITGVKYSKVKKGSCKYKYKKKFGKYTVKFKTGGYKYEVDIAAATGKIIEYDKELIGR